MRTRMRTWALGLIGILTVAGSVMASEDPTTGIPEFGSVHNSGFDVVNRENLNVNFSIPVLSKPGRGIPLAHDIVYDSLVWRIEDGAWTPVNDREGTLTLGWKVGSVAGQVTFNHDKTYCYDEFGFPSGTEINRWGYVYTDASGTSHPFDVDFVVESGTCGSNVIGSQTGFATDGSGLFLDATNLANEVISYSSGLIQQVEGVGRIVDRDGNRVYKIETNDGAHWIDTLDQVALQIVEGAGFVDLMTQDENGNFGPDTTVRVNYGSFDVKTKFSCAGVAEFNSEVDLPVSVDLPNGLSYQFTYEETPGPPGYVTGRISELTLPRGGRLIYEPLGSNGGIDCTDGSLMHLRRTIDDGTRQIVWEFQRTLIDAATDHWKTVQIAPQMPYDTEPNESVYEYMDGKELLQQVYQGTEATGSLLLTVSTTWSGDGFPETQQTTLDDGSVSLVETDWDNHGNVLEHREYTFGAGTPGSLQRSTVFQYLDESPYDVRQIRDLATRMEIYDGSSASGTLVYRADFEFDDYTNTEWTCITDAPGRQPGYGCSHSTRGNLTSSTEYADLSDPANPTDPITRTYHYDSLGNVRRVDLNGQLQQRTTFSNATGYAFAESSQVGPDAGPNLVTFATHNLYSGRVGSSTDENGQVSTYGYDSFGRVSSATRPSGLTVTTTYDEVAGSVTSHLPVAGVSVRRDTTYLDGLGRTFRVEVSDEASPSNVYSRIDTEYDPLGRSYRVSNPHDDVPLYWTETRFDALGRPTVQFDGGGSATSNNITWQYDGPRSSVIDGVGNRRQIEVDALGQLVRIVEPNVITGALNVETFLEYDGNGRLSRITQGSQVRTTAYDALGRILNSTKAEGTGPHTFAYDALGRLSAITDPRGVTTQIVLDDLHRPTSVSYDVGSSGVTPSATKTMQHGTDPASNNNGRLILTTDGEGSESLEYDLEGRVTRVTRVTAGTSLSTQFGYTPTGELESITYPSGRQVVYQRDEIGRAVGLQDAVQSYVSNLSFDPAGQVTALDFGNGVHLAQVFDPATLQLIRITHSSSAGALLDLSYDYDSGSGNNNQIRSITDHLESGRSATYDYDPLGRLKSAQTQGASCGSGGNKSGVGTSGGSGLGGQNGGVDINENPPSGGGDCTAGLPNFPKWQLNWQHDRYGNIQVQNVSTAQNRPGDPMTPGFNLFVDPSSNRINNAGFGYDANGNLLSDGSFIAVYDAEDRLVSMTQGPVSATYGFDASGRRVRKQIGATTTTYVWAGGSVIAEYVNGVLDKELIYFGELLVATHDGGSLLFHHNDHLSTRLMTSQAAQVLSEQGHYPFGESWYSRPGSLTDRTFSEYERDEESGLDYAVNRFYESRVGRFTSLDPLPGSASNPQTLNRYTYSMNDPVNLHDPGGLTARAAATVTAHWVARRTISSLTSLGKALGVPVNTTTNAQLRAGAHMSDAIIDVFVAVDTIRLGAAYPPSLPVAGLTASAYLGRAEGHLDLSIGALLYGIGDDNQTVRFTTNEPLVFEVKGGRWGRPQYLVNPEVQMPGYGHRWQQAWVSYVRSSNARYYRVSDTQIFWMPCSLRLGLLCPEIIKSEGELKLLEPDIPNATGMYCNVSKKGDEKVSWGCEYVTVLDGAGSGEFWGGVWDTINGGAGCSMWFEGVDICGSGGGGGPRPGAQKY